LFDHLSSARAYSDVVNIDVIVAVNVIVHIVVWVTELRAVSHALPHNIKEACKLVKAGFDYVCEMENGEIFRKRC